MDIGVARPVVTPLHQSVVYAAGSPDQLDAQYSGALKGYTYAREGHPNAAALAARIDALEGAEGGMITGSGMAAITAVLLGLLKAGDHMIGADQLYGRSLRLMAEDLPRLGIETGKFDPTDAQTLARAIQPNTKLVLVEALSNPTLRVADMAGIAEICRAHGVVMVLDNTFTTPAMLKSYAQGADIIVHSVTKLLAGHADVTLGYVAAKDPAQRKAIYDFAVTTGMTPAPYECWLAERGLFTFDLRYARAQENATALADYLASHPKVTRVLYPTRPDHPDHNRALALFAGQGGNMLSFEIAGGRAAANRFVEAAPDIAFAPTLGDVACSLSHPASSSHRALTPEGRAALGISEGFFRLSVGIEDINQLKDDIARALEAV
ncbi:aminotransferase class I/II-fold pyridoxal phosphate-dependent enzyme [Rhodobacteraceae bacterium XHP0102]|nr:aminotransferase class I/II-fold pyridoxal phosphate-dependent enzyme [Rhodobacteraceae bacterium XHP0102]